MTVSSTARPAQRSSAPTRRSASRCIARPRSRLRAIAALTTKHSGSTPPRRLCWGTSSRSGVRSARTARADSRSGRERATRRRRPRSSQICSTQVEHTPSNRNSSRLVPNLGGCVCVKASQVKSSVCVAWKRCIVTLGCGAVVAGWVDSQTRAVVLELTVYNPTQVLLCSAKLLFEFTPMGKTSHWRDCHFADIPSPFSRRFNSDGEGASAN